MHFETEGEWIKRNQTPQEIEWDSRHQHCVKVTIRDKYLCPAGTVQRTRQWHWQGTDMQSLFRQRKKSRSQHVLGTKYSRLSIGWQSGCTLGRFHKFPVTGRAYLYLLCSWRLGGN